jgi:hypothetical protein
MNMKPLRGLPFGVRLNARLGITEDSGLDFCAVETCHERGDDEGPMNLRSYCKRCRSCIRIETRLHVTVLIYGFLRFSPA